MFSHVHYVDGSNNKRRLKTDEYGLGEDPGFFRQGAGRLFGLKRRLLGAIGRHIL